MVNEPSSALGDLASLIYGVVFSTTSRELYDPTARRLENFWTRVLGGDRRYLSGKVIARLFKDISEEASFVKLRGPDNRYEPVSLD